MGHVLANTHNEDKAEAKAQQLLKEAANSLTAKK
jgi:hypothetical protein